VLKALLFVCVGTGVAAAWYAVLPTRAQNLPPAAPGLTQPVRGAIHVHSTRSDGTANVEAIAAAAARAGLQFVIFTDHGDGLREPDPPQYLDGVLCIDAVEISTENGHIVALGLPESPYPLGGEGRDVLEDIARLGGFAIAAHPESAKAELRWTAWESPLGGLEWLNADSEWRDESGWSLARALFTYPARGTETLASLLDRPASTLERWDNLTRSRRVVGVAGSDAHARIGLRSVGEPYDNNASSLHFPSYEQVFRMFSNALPGTTLNGDAEADGAAVISAIRAGHVYSTIDALAGPAAMSFSATSGSAIASAGDVLPLSGPVALRIDVQAPPEARVAVLRDGNVMEMRTGPQVELAAPEAPGVYRVEISLPGTPGQPAVPWIVSNPIYAGRDAAESPPPARPRATTFAVQYKDGPAQGWVVEKSDASLGAIDVVKAVTGTQISLRYGLGGAASASPYVAFVMPAGPDLQKFSQLTFIGRADKPTRVSVQLRDPVGSQGERWHRSVYLEQEPREVTVYFDDMTPRGPTSRPQPNLATAQAVLFVMETVNTTLGGNGTIWIDDVRYGR
jgi:hypothetical protein